VEEEALLDRAYELSGLHDKQKIITQALQDFVKKLQFEKDRKDLREHLDKGMAEIRDGEIYSEEEMDTSIDNM
jgi:predicted transcriptional regulator